MWWIFLKVSFFFSKIPQPYFLGENTLNMEKSHFFIYFILEGFFLSVSSVYQLELPSWSLESIFVSGSLHNSCPLFFFQEQGYDEKTSQKIQRGPRLNCLVQTN